MNLTSSFDPRILSHFDFTDKSDMQGLLRGGCIALLTIVIIVILLRIYVRAWMVRDVKADDYMIFAAAAFNFAICAMILKAIEIGFGKHIWNTGKTMSDMIAVFAKIYPMSIPLNIVFKSSFVLTKLSIVVSLLRVFGTDRTLRIVMWTTAVVSTMATLAVMMTYVFQCKPVQAAWDINLVGEAKCISVVTLSQVGSCIIIVTDLVFVIFPIPYLWRLNMPLKKRLALCALFATGLIACAATVMRLVNSTDKLLIDTTYEASKVLGWSYLESSVGIICASIPSLAPLLRWSDSRSHLSDPERRAAAANKPRTGLQAGQQRHRQAADEDVLDDVTYTGDTVVEERDGEDDDEEKIHTVEKIAPVDSASDEPGRNSGSTMGPGGGLSPPPGGS